jgi:hypothetical protein
LPVVRETGSSEIAIVYASQTFLQHMAFFAQYLAL